MATATSTFMTNEEKSIRRREFLQCMEPFSKMLNHIYTIMPHPGYIMKEGTWQLMPPFPEWQKKIDEVMQERDKYVKKRLS